MDIRWEFYYNIEPKNAIYSRFHKGHWKFIFINGFLGTPNAMGYFPMSISSIVYNLFLFKSITYGIFHIQPCRIVRQSKSTNIDNSGITLKANLFTKEFVITFFSSPPHNRIRTRQVPIYIGIIFFLLFIVIAPPDILDRHLFWSVRLTMVNIGAPQQDQCAKGNTNF